MIIRFTRGIVIASILIVFLVGVAHAAPGRRIPADSGGLTDDPTLTATQARLWSERTVAKEKDCGINLSDAPRCTCGDKGSVGASCILAPGKYGLEGHTATNFAQETSFWCGPASARQSLSWHKRQSGSGTALPSQTTLANRIIPEGGTASSTTKIASVLNGYSPTFGSFGYVASDLTNQSNPLGAFYERIGNMVSATIGTVPVILADTTYIPRYNGHYSRHYISVSGIDDRTAPVKMRSVDCNWTSTYRGIYWDPVGCTAANGLCRACYKADVNGSNLAMAW